MNRRGVVHTIDALLAAAIMTTALLYASQIPRERDITMDLPLDAVGMQALVALENNGTLGRLVNSQSWNELERVLRVALPLGASFNVTVYDEQGAPVNGDVISNGGLHGRTVESVEYLLAVEEGACPLYRVRLQLGG